MKPKNVVVDADGIKFYQALHRAEDIKHRASLLIHLKNQILNHYGMERYMNYLVKFNKITFSLSLITYIKYKWVQHKYIQYLRNFW